VIELLSLERRRRIGNHLFAVFATLCFFVALVPLVSIIYQTVAQGYTALSLNFFTKVTPPIGGTGGGILNAIEGSVVMVVIASMIGIPVGVFAGAYLSEYPGRLAYSVRLLAEVLTGVPSIVTGIVVYVLLVVTLHRFSAFSGGGGFGVHDDSDSCNFDA
jgi:phosphate transport system permease protein